MSKPFFFFSMNKNIAGACHLTFVAFLFLSPLTYWRGTGFNATHYLMTCMSPLFLMIAQRLEVQTSHHYLMRMNSCSSPFLHDSHVSVV